MIMIVATVNDHVENVLEVSFVEDAIVG